MDCGDDSQRLLLQSKPHTPRNVNRTTNDMMATSTEIQKNNQLISLDRLKFIDTNNITGGNKLKHKNHKNHH